MPYILEYSKSEHVYVSYKYHSTAAVKSLVAMCLPSYKAKMYNILPLNSPSN